MREQYFTLDENSTSDTSMTRFNEVFYRRLYQKKKLQWNLDIKNPLGTVQMCFLNRGFVILNFRGNDQNAVISRF